MKHIVMFSGGIGSWAAAKRVAEQHGTDELYLVFADVKGGAESNHIGEDEDTYRFIEDAVRNIGGHYIYLNAGKDIWQVFKDQRFLGNSRLAPCSKVLKQKPAKEWINNNCDPESSIIYVGIDWSEIHRMPAIVEGYKPFVAKAPLTEPPYLDKAQLIEWARSEGLKTPRLYDLGFAHNNCGGGCVRAGHGQFKKLYQIMPERYKVWEEKENEMRSYLDKDVSILNKVVNGEKQPFTLTQLRHELDQQPMLIDDYDIGGCNCFIDEETSE